MSFVIRFPTSHCSIAIFLDQQTSCLYCWHSENSVLQENHFKGSNRPEISVMMADCGHLEPEIKFSVIIYLLTFCSNPVFLCETHNYYADCPGCFSIQGKWNIHTTNLQKAFTLKGKLCWSIKCMCMHKFNTRNLVLSKQSIHLYLYIFDWDGLNFLAK